MKHRAKGRRITDWFIYMPLPVGYANGAEVPTAIKIGGVPLKLKFGSTSHKHEGRITGIGLDIDGAPESQLFRMDAGPIDPNHGGAKHGPTPKGNEVSIWDDLPDFHYHVMRIQ